LILRRNLLKTLPDNIRDLKRLKELDLSDNKISKIPECVFEIEQLCKLNLNMNLIESLEYKKINLHLNYFYLSHNNFTNFPLDIIMFKKLIHLSLDDNKISDIPNEIFTKSEQRLKISLLNNCLKNRDIFGSNSKNDILDLDEIRKDRLKMEKEDPTLLKKDGTMAPSVTNTAMCFGKHSQQPSLISLQSQSTIDVKGGEVDQNQNIIMSLLFKNALHYREKQIIDQIKTHLFSIKDKNKANDDKSIYEFFLFERRLKCLQILEDMIINQQERDIPKFTDWDLKLELKICYEIYNKLRKYAETGIRPDTNQNDTYIINNFHIYLKSGYIFKSDFLNKFKEIKSIAVVESGEDYKNLIFIKDLYKNLTSAKIKVYVQYLANLDIKLHTYVKELFDSYDLYTLIFLLTEMRVFLKILIDNYLELKRGIDSVKFFFKITRNSNVIHK
jgi:hypothetical protein